MPKKVSIKTDDPLLQLDFLGFSIAEAAKDNFQFGKHAS